MSDQALARSVESFSSLLWRRFKRHRLAVVSLSILIILTVLAILAPWIESALGVSHGIARLSGHNLGPSWPHLLGTNELGQDIFCRLLYGGRVSLSVGLIAASASALIGATVGLLAGYYGGLIDAALMRFTDAMLSVPILPFMIVFAALDLNNLFMMPRATTLWFLLLGVFGLFLALRFIIDDRSRRLGLRYFMRLIVDGLMLVAFFASGYWLLFRFIPWPQLIQGNGASMVKLILIIVFFGWMGVARLARASALQLKNMEFVTAAGALGATNRRIILLHIFPNALAPILVAATLEVGENILYEAALSFLGLGIQPPVSSWGNMLSNAVDYIKTTPSLAFWPGLFILTTVACFNFLGDGMRDALDPHQVIKRAKRTNPK